MADEKAVAANVAGEQFTLSRWSRLKRNAAATAVAPKPATDPAAPEERGPGAAAAADAASTEVPAAAAELSLPPMSSISLAEDFTPFMQAKVPQWVRQQALKALFKEPHFNVMDRLDTYIDDYTQFEPIPPEVLETLASWKAIKNPIQQVVTSGGYAVDVESEEGRAVLAARARAAEAAAADDSLSVNASIDGTATTPEATAGQPAEAAEAEHATDAADPLQAPDAIAIRAANTSELVAEPDAVPVTIPTHIRHGRRVGEFSASRFAIDNPAAHPTAAPDAGTDLPAQ